MINHFMSVNLSMFTWDSTFQTFSRTLNSGSIIHTVDGSEIRRSPVEVDSLSHYLQGFIHPRWCRISSINSINSSPTSFSHVMNSCHVEIPGGTGDVIVGTVVIWPTTQRMQPGVEYGFGSKLTVKTAKTATFENS